MKTLRILFSVMSVLAGAAVQAANPSLANLSTLGQAGGSVALTSGFSISGNSPKTILIRAVGPTMATFGLSGVLAHPVLTLMDGKGAVVATDDTWGGTSALVAAMQQVQAFALPTNSLDAALLVTLNAGTFTAQATGKGAGSGLCLIEVYDVSGPSSGSQLQNVSSIVPINPVSPPTFGFIVSAGAGSRTLIIRCVGGSLLSTFGVPGTLPDPNLVVVNATTGQVISSNNDWSSGDVPSLMASFAYGGAFPLVNPSKDAALVANFAPGNYTIQATGNGGSGNALVEIYDITPLPSTVTLAATQANADTSGSNPGIFTVTRNGDTSQPITVNYTVTGSAVPDLDYPALPGFVTIPAGASAATVTVAPNPKVATGTLNVVLTLGGGANYTLGSSASASMTITELSASLYVARLSIPAGTSSTASGTATILLSPDGTAATVSIAFSGLSSAENVAHLIIGSPGSGTALNLTLPYGQVSNVSWTFTPSGAYSSAALLQALKSGQIGVEIDTANFASGELTGQFIQATGSQTFSVPPSPPILPASALGAPTDATNAVRFLTQATFGPTNADIQAVMARGVTGWINDQMALPASSHLAGTRADAVAFPNVQSPTDLTFYYTLHVNRDAAWWKIALTAPDQLRQRVAFALSEILVVSRQGAGLDHQPEPMAKYYDLLVNDAFGNFRTLLQDVTLNPVMGTYLSSIHNQKGDASKGTSADENYAREVQQLFTIGLVMLQPDGTLQLDSTGQPIPTYNQATIVQTANVFTGWSFASPGNSNFFYNPLAGGVLGAPYPDTNAWLNPMAPYDAYHDTTAKTIVGGAVIPAGGTTASDLKFELDALFNHPNTGVFIGKQLIQRLVTSNPSPGYVYRVAQVFANDGTGTRGNLGAVVRAILTDYEARSASVVSDVGYGKLAEPLLRFTGLLRAMNATSQNGRYIDFVTGAAQNASFIADPTPTFEQSPLDANTVFNFFAPSYVLPGPLASAGLVGPEFQITDAASSITVPNAFNTYVFGRIAPQPSNLLVMDLSSYSALAATPPALMDQMSLLFCGNAMTTATRTRILAALQALALANATPLQLAQTALFLTVTSPEAAVQR